VKDDNPEFQTAKSAIFGRHPWLAHMPEGKFKGFKLSIKYFVPFTYLKYHFRSSFFLRQIKN
jgi:hypothetical protein